MNICCCLIDEVHPETVFVQEFYEIIPKDNQSVYCLLQLANVSPDQFII